MNTLYADVINNIVKHLPYADVYRWAFVSRYLRKIITQTVEYSQAIVFIKDMFSNRLLHSAGNAGKYNYIRGMDTIINIHDNQDLYKMAPVNFYDLSPTHIIGFTIRRCSPNGELNELSYSNNMISISTNVKAARVHLVTEFSNAESRATARKLIDEYHIDTFFSDLFFAQRILHNFINKIESIYTTSTISSINTISFDEITE